MMTAPYALAAAAPPAALPAPPTLAALPVWHSLLEERWQQRLSTLTELSLAYHDAAESCHRPASAAETARLARLLRDATAARRALGET